MYGVTLVGIKKKFRGAETKLVNTVSLSNTYLGKEYFLNTVFML